MPRTYYPVGHPKHKVRKNKKSGRSGKALSKFKRAHFIAWDTEGSTINGVHRTICLCNSEGFVLSNPNGLSTVELLTALCGELAKYPKAIHVGFAFGYDVNMLLGDCTQSAIEALVKNKRCAVHVNGQRFWCEFIPRKYVSLYHWIDGFKSKKRDGGRIWDVFGFFQKSFVEAVKEWLPEETGIGAVQSMKDYRADFRPEQLGAITAYCEEECRLLVKLMLRLHEGLQGAKLEIRRWDGAGAIAATLLAAKDVALHLPRENDTGIVDTPARYAYFGGRIECVRFGHAASTPIYRYDLVSAYPAALTTVPSLRNGRWRHTYGRPTPLVRFACYHIRWNLTCDHGHALYPFPWRDADGYVYFPQSGEGWVWAPEYEAALFALDNFNLLKGTIEVIEIVWWESNDSVKPFAWIPETFAERKRMKDVGHPAQFALKLGLNSCYGKLAQHVTYTIKGKGTKPKWHCLPWAGWTTSYTRAQVYRAACEAGWNNVIMLATDGVFSLTPIGYCDESNGKNLGQWERTVFNGCTVVQSGVYWLDKEGAQGPTASSPSYTRGFERRNVNRWDIIRAWAECDNHIDTVCRRFIGMTQAVRGRWHLWRHWTDETDGKRNLDLYPTGSQKREVPSHHGIALVNPSMVLRETQAVTPPDILMGYNMLSQPVKFSWTDDDDPARALHDERAIEESDEAEL